MALRKLEISEGRLVIDNAVGGGFTTVPPKGVAASVTGSNEGAAVALNVRWTIESAPDRSAPMELFGVKMGGFISSAAFVGGRKYELASAEAAGGRKLGFPYSTYYKFRIKTRASYDAAVYAKMPIACWQGNSIAFAIVFPKDVILPRGPAPVFIRASGAGAGVSFSAAVLGEFVVERKAFGWFGRGSTEATYKVNLEKGSSFDACFLLIAGDSWVDCMEACHEHFMKDIPPVRPLPPGTSAAKLKASLSYYDRVWDAKNSTHVHLPVKNEVRFESVEFKHSHVTDDLTKLVLYRRLIGVGCERPAARERELLEKLASGDYCYRLDGARLWHTTTRFDGGSLHAFTHHGTGFVGFPGGMATTTRRLFEYCLLNPHDTLDGMARAAADWLVETQGKNGSWPALLEDGGTRTHEGCIASTAEAVRALLSAHRHTHSEEYRNAAEAGLAYIARDSAFFECRQYLRDVDFDNSDGLTAEACIHAFLDWHDAVGDAGALERAEKWGWYALGWIRPRSAEYRAEPSFDGLSRSITPRIDVWGELLMARAFFRLSKATGERRWRDLAWRLFENIVHLQERDGGFSETWFLDFPSGLQSVHIEPTFVTDAFIECVLDLWESGEEHFPLGEEVFGRDFARYPPLEPAEESPGLISVADDRPEFVLDDRLRIVFALDGGYTMRDRGIRAAYSAARRFAPGRLALKLVPALKIVFNRHELKPPQTSIGASSFTRKLNSSTEDSRGKLQMRRFHTAFHDIALSLVSEGLDSEGFPAADLELTAKTLAGDLRVRQVRIDLEGHYEIISIGERNRLLVACGGHEYSIEVIDGCAGEILGDGERLAFDISMCSNWNFFGEFGLTLRVTRRPRSRTKARS